MKFIPQVMVPGKTMLKNFQVQRPGYEAIRQNLYDYGTYAAAGQTQLSFFQTPQGSGGKTAEDTNMELAGALPNGKDFLVESIQISVFPGILPTTYATTIAATNFANDIYTIGKLGYLDFFIGSKSYLIEGPLLKFPPFQRLNVEASHSQEFKQAVAAAEEKQLSTDYAHFDGRPYELVPPILLESVQNFKITLNWGAVQALPSAVDARIGITLGGILYRKSQ